MSVLILTQSPAGTEGAGGPVAAVSATADLLGTVLWPLVVLVVVLVFRRPLVQFLDNLQQVTVKAPGGAEASLTARAEAAVVAAEVDKSSSAQPATIERALRDTRAVTTSLPPSGLLGRTALWVDDDPDGNRHEHAALVALGLSITDCRSSAEALQLLNTGPFDVVISDVGRPEGPDSGFDLLDAIRKSGRHVPYVIYTASASPQDVAAAVGRGAYGYTASPSTLVRLVSEAIEDGPAPPPTTTP